jgi:beta-phosphoglucomutase
LAPQSIKVSHTVPGRRSIIEHDWPLHVDLRSFDALLFDLDGTLLDTMPLHGRAYVMAFHRLGYQLRIEDYLANVGPPARIAIAAFAAAAGMKECDDVTIRAIHSEKKRSFAQLLVQEPPPALNSAKLLTSEHGKLMAVVSSGNQDGVAAILQRMNWHHLFGVVVSGDDTERGKPAPDPYFRAADTLGVSPERCLVFEDTEAGIQAAIAARMSVVDVTRPGVIQFATGVRE